MEHNPYYTAPRTGAGDVRMGELHRGMPYGQMPRSASYGQMRRVGQSPRLSVEPDGCDCDKSSCGQECIASKQLFMPAMAYVPDHDFDNILPMETGFCVGTIFGCLHLPFTGKEVR